MSILVRLKNNSFAKTFFLFSWNIFFAAMPDFKVGLRKELRLGLILKFSNSFIFATGWCKLLIFQTWIIWVNRVHSLKYLSSTTMVCKDIGIYRKLEFVAILLRTIKNGNILSNGSNLKL